MRTARLLTVSRSIPCIGGEYSPPPPRSEQTHTCENITFAQLRLQAVKMTTFAKTHLKAASLSRSLLFSVNKPQKVGGEYQTKEDKCQTKICLLKYLAGDSSRKKYM